MQGRLCLFGRKAAVDFLYRVPGIRFAVFVAKYCSRVKRASPGGKRRVTPAQRTDEMSPNSYWIVAAVLCLSFPGVSSMMGKK